MSTFQEDVTKFHRAMGHPAPIFPIEELTEEIKDHLRKRSAWMIEEAEELVEALEADDLVGVMDALVDSTYFSVGGFVAIGHWMLPYWGNVQESNMAKLGPDGKPVPHPTLPGKIGKPEGWVPPEEEHKVKLDQELRGARIEIEARRWAYAVLKDSTKIFRLRLDLGAQDLIHCSNREAQIENLGADEIVKLYQEVIQEHPELAVN